MMLNHKHSFDYQCQMQMSVTETSYCDLVVWSETGDFLCERILPDTDFISEQLNVSKRFFTLPFFQNYLANGLQEIILLCQQ